MYYRYSLSVVSSPSPVIGDFLNCYFQGPIGFVVRASWSGYLEHRVWRELGIDTADVVVAVPHEHHPAPAVPIGIHRESAPVCQGERSDAIGWFVFTTVISPFTLFLFFNIKLIYINNLI